MLTANGRGIKDIGKKREGTPYKCTWISQQKKKRGREGENSY